jgi:hypothetical protein
MDSLEGRAPPQTRLGRITEFMGAQTRRFNDENRNAVNKAKAAIFAIVGLWLLATMLGVVAEHPDGNTTNSTVTAPEVPDRISRLAYHDLWRKLWEDHVTWTRVVILGILDELPDTPAYTQRLLENPGDMANALRSFYGDDADELGPLLRTTC